MSDRILTYVPIWENNQQGEAVIVLRDFNLPMVDIKQKLALFLPFAIERLWQYFSSYKGKNNKTKEMFVAYCISMEKLSVLYKPTIYVYSENNSYQNERRVAHISVSLKIKNSDCGEIAQAVIFLESYIFIKNCDRKIEIGENILKCLADSLNILENSDTKIKKWHFNELRKNIILILPSRLNQHIVFEEMEKCMEKWHQ